MTKSTIITSPMPSEIKAHRLLAGLTQKAAAELVFSSLRAWEEWESGRRRMHAAQWKYFLIAISEFNKK
jgi:DNA-binding transcriptional regulator YiaG